MFNHQHRYDNHDWRSGSTAAKSVFDGAPGTFSDYVRSLRFIASEIAGMSKDQQSALRTRNLANTGAGSTRIRFRF